MKSFESRLVHFGFLTQWGIKPVKMPLLENIGCECYTNLNEAEHPRETPCNQLKTRSSAFRLSRSITLFEWVEGKVNTQATIRIYVTITQTHAKMWSITPWKCCLNWKRLYSMGAEAVACMCYCTLCAERESYQRRVAVDNTSHLYIRGL